VANAGVVDSGGEEGASMAAQWEDLHDSAVGRCPRRRGGRTSTAMERVDGSEEDVTSDFKRKTECISYVRRDQNYTHMIENRL
jgi:hypothetical protein